MPYTLWQQDNFTKGELSPYMYARSGSDQYFSGLKQAQNVLTYPTGAAGKRFGILFCSIVASITNSQQFYFETFQYLDTCIFQLVFTPTNIAIYLEGLLINNVTTTLTSATVPTVSTTVLGPIFRVAGIGIKPFDLTVSLDSGTVITGVSGNSIVVGSSAFPAGKVVPVQFTNSGGTLPTTSPQILAGVNYFINSANGTSSIIYQTSEDARFGTNPITISSAGSGTNKIFQLNTWTWANTTFKNLPIYDFGGVNYDAITFTPSATTGAAVTLTASSSIFTSAYIGGAFIGAGGTSRITAVSSGTVATVAVQSPFDGTGAIQGSLSLLAEPAWSDARGWPQKCSSYQNRAIFANTVSLPNGFWASVVNEYPNFGDLTNDDDDAISWFPTSNNVNVIRFIVPFRSITIHTNTGIYSSPLSEVAAITPNSFTFQLQDSTPADVLLPQAIDNQIIVLSGNDAHTMLWDGINNAYTSNIVSVVNEQVIRSPVDETAYADLTHAGSRYVFIVNASGSMAIFQTLLAETISGFTPQILEQSYGTAQFRQVASSTNGRAWFVNERQQATALSPVAISGHTTTSLIATASNLSTTIPTAVTFTTSGSLPTSTPQLAVNTYYWAIGIDANTFAVYLTQEDALASANVIQFTTSGTSSNVVPWPLATIFTLEELTWDTFLDCGVYYNGSPSNTITTGTLFNAQTVKMVGDGFGFDASGIQNEVVFKAHGILTDVSEAYIGFPIQTIIEPLPIAAPPGQNTTLTKPKHVRFARFIFNNTIGGEINGIPIALNSLDQSGIGFPPQPARGYFEISVMRGWDDYNVPTFVIEHDDPFNIQLLGVQYSVEI